MAIRNHDGCIKGYHDLTDAWFNKNIEPKFKHKLSIGMYHPEGGTSGEFYVKWEDVGGSARLVPTLEVFDDGWAALSMFTDLIQELGTLDSENISCEEFKELLDRIGFKDLTRREKPYKEEELTEEDYVSFKMPKIKAEKLGLLKLAETKTEE